MLHTASLFFVLCLALLLTGCGQKGPLVLPDAQSSTVSMTE